MTSSSAGADPRLLSRVGHDELPSHGTVEDAQELYEHAPCGYLSTAADGTILRVNATLLDWLGLDRDALVGHRFQDLLPPGPRVLWQTHHQRSLLEARSVSSAGLELVAADGARLPVLLSGRLVDVEDGPPVMRLTLFDGRERRARERRLVQARDAAEEAERQVRAIHAVTAACVGDGSPDELLERAAQAAVEALLARSGGVWLAEGADLVLRRGVDLPVDLLPTSVPLSADHPLSRAAPGDGLQVTDLPRDPLALSGRTRDGGALIVVPLTDGPSTAGVLALVLARGSTVSDAQRAVLQTLGAQVGQALTRARLRAEAARRQAFTDALLDNVDVGIVACDAAGLLTTFNTAAQQWHGMDADPTMHPSEMPAAYDLFEADGTTAMPVERIPLMRALREGSVQDLELVIAAAGQPPRHLLCTGQRLADGTGNVLGAVVAMSDVTAQRGREQALRASIAFHDAVLVASADLFYVYDALTGVPAWTSGAAGVDPDPVHAHPEDVLRLQAADVAGRGLQDGGVLQVRYRSRADSTSEWRWVARRVTPFERDTDGAVTRLLATARDVTEVVEAEHRLREASLHDPLTGLPNRALLGERLTAALARAATEPTAVLFCDLDGFKAVNDDAGHAAGDAVLRAVAARLRTTLRPEDTVARVGGDEFVVLLAADGRGTPEAEPEQAALAVADRIRAAVSVPVVHDGLLHEVTVSIGVTLACHGASVDAVLGEADSAMYRAKRAGKARAEVFSPALRQERSERSRVERLLREALRGGLTGSSSDAGELWLAYQPVHDLTTGRVVSVEALARLRDRTSASAAVPPDVFIPLAEETGLILTLGELVLAQACTDLAVWRRTGADLGVAVNVSAHQLRTDDLAALVQGVLARTGVGPRHLTLELTESALIEADPATVAQLAVLRERGIGIAIDDFGTGWASLRYLTELPVSAVKVDRSFTSGLPDDPAKSTIVRMIATLAAELSLGCVVEGIETEQQLQALPGGVLGQGYLLGRPRPAAEISALLAAGAVVPWPRRGTTGASARA